MVKTKPDSNSKNKPTNDSEDDTQQQFSADLSEAEYMQRELC